MKIACDFDLWPIEKVTPYHANIKKHPESQITQLASMIAEYGWDQPIVVDEHGIIIKGHGRLEAAKRLGMTEVPIIVRSDLTPAQIKAARIADNKVAESEWDLDNLKLEMAELEAMDFDLELTGFDEDEQEKLLAEPLGDGGGLTDPDAIPENVETRCKPGDLWELGRHRLLCGDSTNIQHVERLMGGEKVTFVYMDPPYGMRLNTNYAITPRVVGKTYAPVIGDDEDFDPRFWFEFFADAREHFWWGADYYCQHLPKGGSWVVWDKKKDDLDESIGTGFELCWSKLPHKRMLARFLWSGFTAKERNEERVHPTQKPIALHEWFFERWGKPDDLVADLFLGSGSTLIACEKTNRRCFGMELDPKYCDVILKRWEEFTGKRATRIE